MITDKEIEIEIQHREWLEFSDERPPVVRKKNGSFDMEQIENEQKWLQALDDKIRNYWVGKKVRFLKDFYDDYRTIKNGFKTDEIIEFKAGNVYEITDAYARGVDDKNDKEKTIFRTRFRFNHMEWYQGGFQALETFEDNDPLFELIN